MKFDKSTVEIITEIAKLLTKIGKTEFTRQDIISVFKWKYPEAVENTINPMIQGMTDNCEGGAPGADGRNILHKVREGVFTLNV